MTLFCNVTITYFPLLPDLLFLIATQTYSVLGDFGSNVLIINCYEVSAYLLPHDNYELKCLISWVVIDSDFPNQMTLH